MENVQVKIFGQAYTIKGTDAPDYIRDIAAFVDAKMNEVQTGTGTADPLRVAILTALTISDELHRLRERHRSLETIAADSVQTLLDLTDNAPK